MRWGWWEDNWPLPPLKRWVAPWKGWELVWATSKVVEGHLMLKLGESSSYSDLWHSRLRRLSVGNEALVLMSAPWTRFLVLSVV